MLLSIRLAQRLPLPITLAQQFLMETGVTATFSEAMQATPTINILRAATHV